MIPLRADVIEAYRTFLGREPESEAAVIYQQTGHVSTVAMVAALLQSAEYRGRDRKCRLAELTGISPVLIALLESFRIAGSPAHGFVIDFIGTRTDASFASRLTGLSGTVGELPVPSDFQGAAVTWAGVLAAVDAAQQRNQFTVVEMAGGWAPWAVSSAVAARQRGIGRVHMFALAADPARAALIAKHLMNNSFNPNEHVIRRATAAPAIDLGAILDSASTVSATIDLCYVALDANLSADASAMSAAAIAALNARVRRLVIATSSRLTEGWLLTRLADHGWALERDAPCTLATQLATRANDGPSAGVQVWRNTGLD
jgi:hypothetical protein